MWQHADPARIRTVQTSELNVDAQSAGELREGEIGILDILNRLIVQKQGSHKPRIARLANSPDLKILFEILRKVRCNGVDKPRRTVFDQERSPVRHYHTLGPVPSILDRTIKLGESGRGDRIRLCHS